MKSYEELNAEFIANEEEIARLGELLEAANARRASLRDQLQSAPRKTGRR